MHVGSAGFFLCWDHLIRVANLSKHYGQFQALREISFQTTGGEILGLLGPNGAGKTTTMRILTGYMPPSSGEVTVAGFDVIQDSIEVRRRVGYVPESVPLYPEMSTTEYLSFMGSLRRVPELDERVAEVLEQVGLSERSESLIGNLSKGLRQRVGLGQALLHRPEVLILDEPTIGLDPAQIIEVRDLIRELGQESTIMLSTHILSEAQQLCDRVLILNRGEIVAEDTPNNLQSQFAGAERVLVRTSAPTEALVRLLADVPGVEQVKPAGAEGAVEVVGPPGNLLRPLLAKTIVAADYDLLELRPSTVSLERIFLQLTQEEDGNG